MRFSNVRLLGCAATLLCCSLADAGPDWIEGDHGDAGTLPKTSQPITTTPSGSVAKVRGRLNGSSGLQGAGGGDFVDMYKFRILDPTEFLLTTACIGKGPCGSAEFNSRLWLFDSEGRGLLANNDTQVSFLGGPSSVPGSTLSSQPCDGSISITLTPGEYYLAITGSSIPFSPSGQIFCFGCPHSESECLGDTELSGPDGPGGPDPLNHWEIPPSATGGEGGSGCDGCGDYEISIQLNTVGILTDPDCPADFNGSGAVSTDDLTILITHFSSPSDATGIGDINHDGNVDIDDLVYVITHWGTCSHECNTPFVCGVVASTPCQQEGTSPCFCATAFAGGTACAKAPPCAGIAHCFDGQCPPGYVCITHSCCGTAPVCVPLCDHPAFANVPPGTLTPFGIMNKDGTTTGSN